MPRTVHGFTSSDLFRVIGWNRLPKLWQNDVKNASLGVEPNPRGLSPNDELEIAFFFLFYHGSVNENFMGSQLPHPWLQDLRSVLNSRIQTKFNQFTDSLNSLVHHPSAQ